MREIRTSGSEGGARFNPLSLPLSERGSSRGRESALNGVGEWSEREWSSERRLTTAATERGSSRGREVRAEWRWGLYISAEFQVSKVVFGVKGTIRS